MILIAIIAIDLEVKGKLVVEFNLVHHLSALLKQVWVFFQSGEKRFLLEIIKFSKCPADDISEIHSSKKEFSLPTEIPFSVIFSIVNGIVKGRDFASVDKYQFEILSIAYFLYIVLCRVITHFQKSREILGKVSPFAVLIFC